MKLFCKVGLHKWKRFYISYHEARGCKRCGKYQVSALYMDHDSNWLDIGVNLHKENLKSLLRKLEVIK